jgi:hypothetical protein
MQNSAYLLPNHLNAAFVALGNSSAFFNAEAAYKTRPLAASKRQRAENIVVSTSNVDAADRSQIEQFIHDVFAQTYGANVQHFMPELVALRDETGDLVAAFGLRNAGNFPLFLEQYLDAPIQTVMSNRLGKSIHRHQITEIGNLAVSNPRNAGVLIAHVIQHSLDVGIAWAVATAHHSLQNGLIKGGRDVFALQAADPEHIEPMERASWGSYYKHLPQVVAIRGVAEI